MTALDPGFWRNRRVLVTGHTGFKGSWLAIWLKRLGAEVTGFALAPQGDSALFTLAGVAEGLRDREGDVRDRAALLAAAETASPEIVFHLAAQPLVRASYETPVDTFATNILGTVHLLDACRTVAPRVVVNVTTDKVYRNLDQAAAFGEDDPLGGYDPYSASKAGAEIVTASYRDSFLAAAGVAVATARAGNVIGGGDWSRDRLLPDAVRVWRRGQTLEVRRPDAVRPWQHVLDAVYGYLLLAQTLWAKPELAGAYNFGPDAAEAATVRHVIDRARAAYGQGAVAYADVPDGPHEAGWLSLATDRVRATLGLVPRWALDEAVARTMTWYHDLDGGAPAFDLCLADIAAFEARP